MWLLTNVQLIFVWTGSGHQNLGHFCLHIWLMYFQGISKILSAQACGLSDFLSNFCLHRHQPFDMTFTGPALLWLSVTYHWNCPNAIKFVLVLVFIPRNRYWTALNGPQQIQCAPLPGKLWLILLMTLNWSVKDGSSVHPYLGSCDSHWQYGQALWVP